MGGYKLGNNAWITTSTETINTEGEKFYADNSVNIEAKGTERVICLRVATTTEQAITIIMDAKQAKAVRKALKMQIKVIENEQKRRRAKQ